MNRKTIGAGSANSRMLGTGCSWTNRQDAAAQDVHIGQKQYLQDAELFNKVPKDGLAAVYVQSSLIKPHCGFFIA